MKRAFRAAALFVLVLGGCSYPVDEFAVDDDASDLDGSLDDASDFDAAPRDSTTIDSSNDVHPTDSVVTDTFVAAPDTFVPRDTYVPPPDTFVPPIDTTPPCPGGGASCGSPPACRVTHDDPKYCSTTAGSCGAACGADQICKNGGCACRPGLMRCGTTCVDTDGEAAQCGKSCSSLDNCTGLQICDDGKCKGGFCALGRTRCGNSCIDLANDPNHCGGCSATPCKNDEVCLAFSCRKYAVAATCTGKGGCDCNSILAGSIACDPFSGTAGSHPICVVGTACPNGAWK